MIKSRSEVDVAEIICRIRAGHSAEAIVAHANTDNPLTISNPQRQALHTFLINLAHSTGSLRQISRLAMSVSTAYLEGLVPDPQNFRIMCNRIVRFSYVDDLLRSSQGLNPISPLLLKGAEQSSNANAYNMITVQDHPLQDGLNSRDDSPHQVTAAPWTTLTTDDEAVSHLVSLFLVWINPTWRFVEPDLFLQGMPSCGDLYWSFESAVTTILTLSSSPQVCARSKPLLNFVRLF